MHATYHEAPHYFAEDRSHQCCEWIMTWWKPVASHLQLDQCSLSCCRSTKIVVMSGKYFSMWNEPYSYATSKKKWITPVAAQAPLSMHFMTNVCSQKPDNHNLFVALTAHAQTIKSARLPYTRSPVIHMTLLYTGLQLCISHLMHAKIKIQTPGRSKCNN